MWPVSSAFRDQMAASERNYRFKAQLFDKNFDPVAISVTLNENDSSGVTIDLQGEPMGEAVFALLDPNHKLPSHRDPIWLSRNVKLTVEELVDGEWIEVPLFFGPVQTVERDGHNLYLVCNTKEVQHLDPHVFERSAYARKHTKIHVAIRHFMSQRGETRMQLDGVGQRLPETVAGLLGVEPWKIVRKLARAADRFLYYRGDGTLRLKPWPDSVAFRLAIGETLLEEPRKRTSVGPVRDTFVVIGQKTVKEEVAKKGELDQVAAAGATSIHLAANPELVDALADGMKIRIGGRGSNDPEVRTIAGSYTSGSRTVPLTRALSIKHGIGAPAAVTVKEHVEKPVVARASLTQNHPLSKEAQTGGLRPRVAVVERPSIHKWERAKDAAESLRDRQAGRSERSIHVSTVPIWFAEIADLYEVGEDRARIQRIFYPLNRGPMEIDWSGQRRPRRK